MNSVAEASAAWAAAEASASSIDWGWTGPGSVAFALIYGLVRWLFSRPRHAFLGRTTRGHFLDGVALFPMGLLVVSPMASGLAEALIHDEGPILAIAGVVAILAVLEPERARTRALPDVAEGREQPGSAGR